MNTIAASFRGRALRIGRRILSHRRLDLPLLIALAVLAMIGLTVLYSASGLDTGTVVGQAVRFGIGAVLLVAVSRIPPSLLRAWTPWFYVFGVLLLVIVKVLGEGAGASRWLDIGVIRFQPSELMKLAMPMMVAWYLHPRPLPPRWRDIAAIALLIGAPTLLIVKQPDLGTAILVAASGMFVLFLAGLPWWKIGAMAAGLAASAPVIWHFLHDYQRQRVLTFMHPESDPLGSGWHIIQSMIAVGSGGVLGKGFNQGTQSKLEFLPEHTTDFIFAVLGEEFGLVGVLVLLAVYVFIIGRCLWIASNARDTYSRLVAGALALAFSVYVIVNGGMITGLLPVVGVPLPLVSYGGTSAITLLVGFGVVMSIHAHRKWTD
ncbi:MAG TPA: rod shape-determining protein RodA [Rhodanobacteraceae bacterium]|jgi:rod shape determining protein RodA|nr:rod shape-determining protein RodA [Rhodanobacteraceae bacterium]